MVERVGGGGELQLQSQEGQELSVVEVSRQLIFKRSSEDQTVDYTNMIMGYDHDTNLYVMS
jgi:hypothetical protein